jgi:hypothetical protein
MRGRILTDAVEKVSVVELEFETTEFLANRFLNQDCVLSLGFESMLPRDRPQNPFSTASTHSGHRRG